MGGGDGRVESKKKGRKGGWKGERQEGSGEGSGESRGAGREREWERKGAERGGVQTPGYQQVCMMPRSSSCRLQLGNLTTKREQTALLPQDVMALGQAAALNATSRDGHSGPACSVKCASEHAFQ